MIPALVLARVNDTAANPAFYARQLREIDFYNFIQDGLLPAAIDNLPKTGSGPDLVWAKTPILAVARSTIPPQWLQTQTENALYAVVPYIMGDTNSFSLTIPLKDRIEAARMAIKSTLRQDNTVSLLLARYLQPALTQGASQFKMLPIQITPTTIQDVIQKVAPPDWLLGQVDAAIDQVIPYMMMDKDRFSVNINISSQLNSLQSVLIDLLKKPEAYNQLTRDFFVPTVKKNLSILPAGITFTDAELTSLVNQAFPLDWYQARVPDLVGQVFAYLRGTSPTFELSMSVADRKPAIVSALSKLVEPKIDPWFNNLPVCSAQQMVDLISRVMSGNLPNCRPPGFTYSQIKTALGIDISSLITPMINKAVPDQFKLSDPDMAASLKPIRDLVLNGFTYTDQDLAKLTGATRLDGIRKTIASGYTFSDKDLRSLVSAGGREQISTFDSTRASMGTARRLGFILWILLAILLAGIGLLGGRRLASKLYWAGGALFITGIIAFLAFGPVYSATAQPLIDAAISQIARQPDPLFALVATKAAALVQNAAVSFVSGLRVESIIILAVALAIVAGGVILDRRRKPAKSEPVPVSLPESLLKRD